MFRLLYIIPKNLLSYFIGKLVHIPLGQIPVCWFAKRYRIDLNEAEREIHTYRSIGELFTRKLKPGIRPIQGDWVHPVDAEIRNHGKIHSGRLIQVKGKDYSLEDLLQDPMEAKTYEGGYFITYYLCPTDYHRIHFPTSGKVTKSHYIPGFLWPVNDWSVESIQDLFAINERAITYLENDTGKVLSVNIGATNVGKISLTYDSDILTNQLKRKGLVKEYSPPLSVNAGDELGIFHMGSTVVLILEKGIMEEENFLFESTKVRMGEKWQKRN